MYAMFMVAASVKGMTFERIGIEKGATASATIYTYKGISTLRHYRLNTHNLIIAKNSLRYIGIISYH